MSLIIFSWSHWDHVIRFLGKTPQKWSLFSSQDIHDLSLMMITLINWSRQCSPVFSNVKLFPPTSHTLFFGRRSLSPSHTHDKQRIKLPLLGRGVFTYIIWNSCVLQTCLFSIYVFLYLYHYRLIYLLYALDYKPIPHYLFCCSNCSRFNYWELL